MTPVLYWLAWLGGSIFGAMMDPVGWGTITIGFILAIYRQPFLWVLAAAAVAAALPIAVNYGWWIKNGFEDQLPSRIASYYIIYLTIASLGYGLGALGRRMFSRSDAAKNPVARS